MNIAEGKGPKQTKKTWPLGQFVTIFGNDGTPGAVNPAAVAYPVQFSGGAVAYATSGGNVAYAQPGSINPGLNLNVNGNAAIDIGFICAPDAQVTLQDIQSVTAVLNAESGWSGTASVSLQGTYDRYTPNAYLTSQSALTTSYNSTNWVTLATASVTTASVPVQLKVASASGFFYNAYRIVASGATASGVVDWSIPGMFADLSAMQIGQEASWIQGSTGQINAADFDILTISGGLVTNYTEGITPNASLSNNHDYIA
jgi:hypothetical protein